MNSLTFPLTLLLSAMPPTLISLGGCGENPISSGAPRIVTGTSVAVTAQTVTASGGTISVTKPGDSLDGLAIDVPNGAYGDARSFRISYAPITEHDFGSDFTLLTPLITIENGGGYSTEPMTVTVPIKAPPGHFAMPFLYDAATNTIEALPLVYTDSTQVRFITRNFEHSATSVFGKRTADASRSAIFISSTDAATLEAEFDSKFEMGIDNFQFVNWGSYIAPKGHCGGQSIAAMWYYSTKKKHGSPGLYGLFDNDGVQRTPNIWYDDMHAFRFCSVVQTKQNWGQVKYYGDKSWNRDLATYRAIAFAIRETGDPQCLLVSDDSISHAIIAYRTSGGKINVCDPNFPWQESREIIFNKGLGDFDPYYSGDNANATGTSYFNIYCAANSALVDWNEMARLWKQVLDGTIGNDVYPTVRLRVRNAENDYVPLEDGVKLSSQVTLDVSADGFEPEFRVFDFATQSMISNNERDFKLSKGKQRIGIYYKGPGTWPESGYIGFTWAAVEVEEEPSKACDASLSIDGVTISLNSSEYLLYEVTGVFGMTMSWPNPKSPTLNSVTVLTREEESPGAVFPGTGSYPLDYHTLVLIEDKGYSCKSGVMNVTRYDSRVEGNFTLTAESITSPGTVISVTGTLSCNKR